MTDRLIRLTAALLVLTGSAALVGAEPVPLVDVLDGLDAGRTVRVHLSDGRLLEGEFSGTAEERLVLRGEHGPEFVPLGSVVALWERGRATGKGGKIGAWTAGLAFAVYGGLIEMVVQYDESFPAAGIMLGGLFGATTGGVTGALVGSAIPDWHLRWGDGAGLRDAVDAQRLDRVAATDGGRLLGQANLGFGVIDPAGAKDDQGLMVAGVLTSSLGRRFRHGVDLSYTENVTARPSRTVADSPYFTGASAAKVWSAGWRLEWSFTQPHGSRWDPYFVAGAGAYGWVETFLGVNYGLGVRWTPRGGGTGAFAEVRRHDNIQNLTETDPGFATGVLGISRIW